MTRPLLPLVTRARNVAPLTALVDGLLTAQNAAERAARLAARLRVRRSP